jgi:hypothetical protein
MININLEIKNENLLGWWLYYDVEKIIYIGSNEFKVETVEELWDYIQKFYN